MHASAQDHRSQKFFHTARYCIVPESGSLSPLYRVPTAEADHVAAMFYVPFGVVDYSRLISVV